MKIISVRQNAKESGYPDETCTKNVQYSAQYIHLYEKRTEKEKFCLFFWRKIRKKYGVENKKHCDFFLKINLAWSLL